MSAAGGTVKATASLTADEPAGIVTVAAPAKVTGRSVSGTTLPLPACRATCTSPTVRGAVPNSLESRTRALVPPMLVCTIWRSVCRSKLRPPLCTATAQVPTHESAGPAERAAVVAGPDPGADPDADSGAEVCRAAVSGSAGPREASWCTARPAARTAVTDSAVTVAFLVHLIAPLRPAVARAGA